MAAVLGQIMTAQPPKPSEIRTELDPALDAICQKMMAKQTVDRYASMKEVAEALTDYLKSGPAASSTESGGRQPTDTPVAGTNQPAYAGCSPSSEDEGLAAFLAAAGVAGVGAQRSPQPMALGARIPARPQPPAAPSEHPP